MSAKDRELPPDLAEVIALARASATTRTMPEQVKPCASGCRELVYGGGPCAKCERAAMESRRAERQARALVPAHFWWASFDAPELRARVKSDLAVAKAKQIAVTARDVVILGPPATGKTSLASAMLRAWLGATRKAAAFRLACELASARIANALRGEAPHVDEAMGASLLVVDDLGGEAVIPTSPLSEILQVRFAHERPTWVTTSMSKAEATARYGAGVARRIFDGATRIATGGA